MTRPHAYDGVAVVCPTTVTYEKTSTRSAHWFLARALAQLIAAAGIAKEEIDGLASASFTLAPDSTIALTEHFGMAPRWIEWLPFGGVSGVMALRRAARAVQMGDANIVACIAGDTANPETFAGLVNNFSSFSSQAIIPYASAGPNGCFSLITQHYMQSFGVTREDFGRIALAQRANAATNPNALLGGKSLTMEDYLAARPVAGPLHLFDCVMPCAGAEGFLVMEVRRARALGLPYATIRGAIERHNAYREDPIAVRSGWAMDRDALYAQSGLDCSAIDCVQTYDDYPVITMMQLEDLGFCAKGEAADFVRRHDLTIQGDFPVNTSGGQLGCGQAGCSGGFLTVVETLRQVTGQPLGGQVRDARIGLASGYGMVTYDRCLGTGAVILEGAR
ncbi:thiolase family protein [Novosphingobium sp. 1949]|uniref:Thiolase family protein n=1 Tax=Novosphingobium organovorum TaxID=2930092 RepID=A0ABT0BC50_9SPHN|nr:thiolase family protein [Novosphingobium organovorum]MCJ2182448.1 thiolase family protein [Novosphingobium organovorum]